MATKKTADPKPAPTQQLTFGSFTFTVPGGYVIHPRAGKLEEGESQKLSKGRATAKMVAALRQIAAVMQESPGLLRLDPSITPELLLSHADALEADIIFENDVETIRAFFKELRMLHKHDASETLSRVLDQVKAQLRDNSTLANRLSELVNLNKRP